MQRTGPQELGLAEDYGYPDSKILAAGQVGMLGLGVCAIMGCSGPPGSQTCPSRTQLWNFWPTLCRTAP